MALTPDELKNLLDRGYSIQDIVSMSPTELSQLKYGNMSKTGIATPRNSNLVGGIPTRTPIGGTATVGGIPVGNSAARSGNSQGGGGSTLFKSLGINPGEVLSGVGAAIANAPSTAKKILQSASSKPRSAGKTRTAATPSSGAFGAEDFGSSYNPDPYAAPELQYRDFSGQARDQVGGIYSPRYAAIDAAIQRAQEQYGRSKQVVGGLYENLAKSTAQTAEDTKARYGQAAQEQQARTNDTRQQVGQNYSSTQNQEAQLLQQLGQQEAAQQVLGDNSAESAYQQSQVDREGQAQLANNSLQGNAQQDYIGNIADAHQTSGAVAQQNLLNQLAGTNAGYEQDRFNLQGDQAQAALQLSQALSDRDFQAQSQNAQLGAQAYGINNQNAQFQAQQNMSAQQQAQEMRYRLQQAQQDQFNADRGYELDKAKYTTGLANDQANYQLEQQKIQGQGQQGLAINDQDPASRTISQITSAVGGDTATARQYYDFVQQATNSFASQGLDAASIIGSQFSFVSEIGRQAQARGLNPITAQAAAAAMWENFLKGQGK